MGLNLTVDEVAFNGSVVVQQVVLDVNAGSASILFVVALYIVLACLVLHVIAVYIRLFRRPPWAVNRPDLHGLLADH